jgi:hypothetical protein
MVEAASCCDYNPMTSWYDDALIEFAIGETGDDYIDLANTYLFASQNNEIERRRLRSE